MKIRELPGEEREDLYDIFRGNNFDPAEVEDLEVGDLVPFLQARSEDDKRKIERQRQRKRLFSELNTLLDPVMTKHPGLPLVKAAWFLPQEQQQRVYVILRELEQQVRPAVITRNRQRWHAAVEDMVETALGRDFVRENGVRGFLVTSHEDLDALIDYVALQVLQQNANWPPDMVRRYAQQLLWPVGDLLL
uniref:Uncharacterized protein n=1 Tax=Solibacter usitatus (strain Ellin6076) TaxID=234267 RepID=Q027Z6_SOLUE